MIIHSFGSKTETSLQVNIVLIMFGAKRPFQIALSACSTDDDMTDKGAERPSLLLGALALVVGYKDATQLEKY